MSNGETLEFGDESKNLAAPRHSPSSSQLGIGASVPQSCSPASRLPTGPTSTILTNQSVLYGNVSQRFPQGLGEGPVGVCLLQTESSLAADWRCALVVSTLSYLP